ncbi:MAG TPA: class I fructose-bisphosphate aldolase [Pseudonocardia sp.]
MTSICRQLAAQLMSPGKGILAADESIATMSRRLVEVGVAATEENRRTYRELLVGTPGVPDGIAGIIFCDETLRQRVSDGRSFPVAVAALDVLPGIKVDTGAKPCPGLPGETVTQGLDGLVERLTEYWELGARFAKWRAVLSIDQRRPTGAGIRANVHALARYAAACQQVGLVPVVEPEVLMDGTHGLARCAEVTASVHAALRAELAAFGVDLAGMVLKPNMVIEGADHPRRASPGEVAEATVRVLGDWPEQLAGIAFLSGGQPPSRATENLAAMQRYPTPWPLTFSFGRALVDPALASWAGHPARVDAGRDALDARITANAAAVRLSMHR